MAIAIFRTSDLLQGESRWLKAQLDSRLGLVLGVDAKFVTSPSEALQANVILALGGSSRAILMGVSTQSDVSARGQAESFADRVVITTWGLAEAIKDVQAGKDFLVDALRARIYYYGLGNRTVGYVSSASLQGATLGVVPFSVGDFEQFVSAFSSALGG